MRILFDNAALRATITSANENANYPASNLVDEFLKIRWQENLIYSIITVAFDNPEDINAVFWSYSNAENIVVFTDTGAVACERPSGVEITSPLGEHIVTSDGYEIGVTPASTSASAVYFDSLQEDVTHLYIHIVGEADMTYLGGIGCGNAIEITRPLAAYTEGIQDNSIVVQSAYGQAAQNYIEPLRVESPTCRGVTREKANEVMAAYKALGVGGKVWVDFTERDHEFRKPMYAQITAPITPTRVGNHYDLTINLTEAR
jgi:hypothetical protein